MTLKRVKFETQKITLQASRVPRLVERGPTGLKGTAKIHFTPVVVEGGRYDSFTVVHYDQGERCRQRFNDYAKAFSHAEEKATQLSGREMAAVSLTNEDQRIYGAAVESLKPLEVSLESAVREYITIKKLLSGVSGSVKPVDTVLESAVRNYIEARELLGDVSVLAAANFYYRHGRSITQKAPLQNILQAMLKGLKSDGRSAYHVRDVERHVEAFIAQHSSYDIQEITTSQINDWLRSLDVKGRPRNNHRDSVTISSASPVRKAISPKTVLPSPTKRSGPPIPAPKTSSSPSRKCPRCSSERLTS